MMTISSPRLTEKFAFQGEVHFTKSSYSSLVIQSERYSTEYHNTFINLSTLSIPLSLKYAFPHRKYGLYVQGGINSDYHLSSSTKHLRERVTGNDVHTFPESTAFEVNDYQIGYWGGVGILKSYKGFTGSLSVRYFQMLALIKTGKLYKDGGFTVNNSRISINLVLSKWWEMQKGNFRLIKWLQF